MPVASFRIAESKSEAEVAVNGSAELPEAKVRLAAEA
jgi:hypothetical protein